MTKVEPFHFDSSDGFRLAGIRTEPALTKGWAILAHGILETKDEYGGFYSDLADELARLGIGSVRFDFRGHGESSGTTLDISVVGDVLDLKAALGAISPVGKGKVALVATSFGSGPAIYLAADLTSQVSSLVLIAPVLDYQRTFLEPRTPWASESFTPEALAAIGRVGYLLLGGTARLSPRLIEEFRLLHPGGVLQQLRLPRMIIHGDQDSMVPFSISQEIARESPDIILHVLRGADHGFTDSDDDTDRSPRSLSNRRELVETAANFVLANLA